MTLTSSILELMKPITVDNVKSISMQTDNIFFVKTDY